MIQSMAWMPLKVYKNCWRFWVFSTFTFAEIAVLCGDICPRAFHSVPFWSWIRARANTCSVSSFTRHAAWLPRRPLTPTTIYWWLEETTHALKWRIKRKRLLVKRCSRMTGETCVVFIQYSNPWKGEANSLILDRYKFLEQTGMNVKT